MTLFAATLLFVYAVPTCIVMPTRMFVAPAFAMMMLFAAVCDTVHLNSLPLPYGMEAWIPTPMVVLTSIEPVSTAIKIVSIVHVAPSYSRHFPVALLARISVVKLTMVLFVVGATAGFVTKVPDVPSGTRPTKMPASSLPSAPMNPVGNKPGSRTFDTSKCKQALPPTVFAVMAV
jgi:hypothetical protein